MTAAKTSSLKQWKVKSLHQAVFRCKDSTQLFHGAMTIPSHCCSTGTGIEPRTPVRTHLKIARKLPASQEKLFRVLFFSFRATAAAFLSCFYFSGNSKEESRFHWENCFHFAPGQYNSSANDTIPRVLRCCFFLSFP